MWTRQLLMNPQTRSPSPPPQPPSSSSTPFICCFPIHPLLLIYRDFSWTELRLQPEWALVVAQFIQHNSLGSKVVAEVKTRHLEVAKAEELRTGDGGVFYYNLGGGVSSATSCQWNPSWMTHPS
uniref:Uncharacterized protein n=1 Tax=Nelumbo nucifera TaxID=4432 RepID=A0A822YG96_NELNU|nr:TPA_asm: hypothetical protein HUJ06_031464 [Nelumbo nucifera]